MSKLAQLKKNRGANLQKLQKKLEEQNQGGGAPRDERIWKPRFNQDKGKGTAIVRFLAPMNGDPFVEVKSYSFTGPGGNFWGMARQTVGEDDPVQLASISAFRKAKNEGDDRLREKAKKWLPRSQYFANVLVIKDEEHPENEGKVKIFQFGRQIYGFIEKAIQPEFDDVDPMDPFDMWSGADFKIRMIGKEIPDQRNPGQKVLVPNYENSEFDRPSELMDGDDEELERLFESTHDLSEFVDPEKVKSFDEVAELFKKATGHPYNWLTSDGVNDHVKEKEQQRELNNSVDNDNGADQHREDDKPEKAPNPMDGWGDEADDDPVAKFRRLAQQNK